MSDSGAAPEFVQSGSVSYARARSRIRIGIEGELNPLWLRSIHTSEAVEAILPPDVIRNLNDPLWRRLREQGCGKPGRGWHR